jgi:hypothetical protein
MDADKAEYRAKIEKELDKPESQQNANKLAFWRNQLDKLEAQQPQGNYIYK